MTRRELGFVSALALGAGILSGRAAAAQSASGVFAGWRDAPLFAAEVERARVEVEASMRGGVVVPVPKDPGGGYTHEQHKRNYRVVHRAGRLFEVTGEAKYADHAREILKSYAALYPTLGPHPANQRGEQYAGRLFWQALNDSVSLVNLALGWSPLRASTEPAERAAIDGLFRQMAGFLLGNPKNFDQMHNHATWATAGVGIAGYAIGDREMVEKALTGTSRDGSGGFLRQIEALFSPDGYYEEGPYYLRYAIMPFMLFAREIERNDPARQIFERRDGVLLKAVRSAVDTTYGTRFIPVNDALKEKTLDTEELHAAVTIAYGRTFDPGFLAIAEGQGRTILTDDGLKLGRDLKAGRARPWPVASRVFRDGPDGTKGALVVLRSGEGPKHAALVAKNTAQGMGHGHFDKLTWLFFDNGREIVTDYGSARFLNIEAKSGGRYLPENTTWAKQTVAHNTVVMNERSHFGGELDIAEKAWPEQLWTALGGDTQIATARMTGAYPGVTMTRTLALVRDPAFPFGLVIDLLRAKGPQAARWDLPLHYAGQLIEHTFDLQSRTAERPVLGTGHGYQHLWLDAVGRPSSDGARLTWLENERFYSFSFLPPAGAQALLVESGANDPKFNLRREPALIQRVDGAAEVVFAGVLEPHGAIDGAAETVVGSHSNVGKLERFSGADADVIVVADRRGRRLSLGVSTSADPNRTHRVAGGGRTYEWTGPWRRFDA